MVTKLVYSYCGAHVVESYRKESSISDTNWLISFCIIIDLNWVEFTPYHLVICIFKKETGISLEQKEIIENSQQHSSSRTGYSFMF